jgi:flagellar basal-body rod modification protein FlgD
MEGLGQDAFMTLLLAQLKNQDPLKPMEDKDFIAQLAQFNSLSQLTEMNKIMKEFTTSQTLAQGSALIGKTVSGLSNDAGTMTGLVSGLRMVSGKVVLEVDGHDMPLERVNSVQG